MKTIKNVLEKEIADDIEKNLTSNVFPWFITRYSQ